MNWIVRVLERLLECFARPPLYEMWMYDAKNWGPPQPVEDLGDPLSKEFEWKTTK